jgi:hypothetical protein
VNGQIELIASWPDQIKSNPAYDWAYTLHFIDTPDWLCSYNYSRDCRDKTYGANHCVDGAIQNYSRRAVDWNLEGNQTVEALKFLVHFIGDIHQPLHVAFSSDLGGNLYNGTFLGLETNLHNIWDLNIIQTRIARDFNNDYHAWVQYLVKYLASQPKSLQQQWQSCSYEPFHSACSGDWAVESLNYACKNAYLAVDGKTHIGDNFELTGNYYEQNLKIVELRLIQGGLRLATVLNSLFSS